MHPSANLSIANIISTRVVTMRNQKSIATWQNIEKLGAEQEKE